MNRSPIELAMTTMQACAPSPGCCPQSARCARRNFPGPVIDASVSLRAMRWCPMFIDRRAAALLAKESDMANPTGCKNGAQALVVQAVTKAGINGMSSEEIRAMFPELEESARKGAINAVHRGMLTNLRSRRLTVYYAPSVSKDAMRASFSQRVKARDAEQFELRRQRKARYLQGLALDAERRQKLREAAEQKRAEHRAEVERQKKERDALRAQQKAEAEARKRTLKAETALNNRLAKKIKGTTRGIVQVPDVQAAEDWSQARVTKAPTPLGRWEVADVPRLFSGQPLLPASSCAARALAA